MIIKRVLLLSISIFMGAVSMVAQATPPERPISIGLVSSAEIKSIKVDEKFFYLPVSLSSSNFDRRVIELSVLVYAPDQLQQKIIQRDTMNVKKPKDKDHVTTVQIPRLKEDGIYKIEISSGDKKGSVYDRVVLYQVVQKEESQLFTQKQWRDYRKEKRLNRYDEAKSVRVFSGNLRAVTPEEMEERKIQIKQGDRQALLVRADKNLGVDAKYVEDGSATVWRARDPVTYRGRMVFTDFEGSVRPLVNAGIYLYDDDTFGDEFLDSVATNGNGEFSFSVNNDDGFLQNGRDLYVKLRLQNTRWRVHDGGDYEWSTDVSDDLNEGQVVDIGTVTPDDDMEAVQIFSFIERAWQHVVTVGGRDPGFVNIDYPGGGDFFDGEVNLSASTNRAPDIAVHEYGHFLMKAAYPGGDPSPGGAHNFGETNQDERLSWSEGWASGFMLSLCNDGEYNWDEGVTEGPGEWPTCTNQNDSGGQELELYSGSNRTGETQEARVAATILDLIDSDNDDNGGSEDRGRDDLEDANTPNRVTLETLYNDVLWGSGHNDALEFWTSLSGEISGDTWSDANELFRYNWMSIAGPIEINCVASKVSVAEIKDYDKTLKDLRAFRDEALKPYVDGRDLMRMYYRHSPELAMLLIKNKDARKHAANIVRHFSHLGKAARSRVLLEELAANDNPFISPDVNKSIESLFELIGRYGSEELIADSKSAFGHYQKIADMNYQQVDEFVRSLKRADDVQGVEPVLQKEYAPASQKADWDLIRKNLPKGMER